VRALQAVCREPSGSRLEDTILAGEKRMYRLASLENLT